MLLNIKILKNTETIDKINLLKNWKCGIYLKSWKCWKSVGKSKYYKSTLIQFLGSEGV